MRIENKQLPDHRHCDMCEEPHQEYYICDKCYHVECHLCYDEWIESAHPCRWLQYKNDCYARDPIVREPTQQT